MLRIWKGPEMEGNDIGIMTMFVCSDKEVEASLLIRYLQNNPDVRRIYFGAGRHAFEDVANWRDLYDYAFARSVDIIIEATLSELPELIKEYDSLITTFIVVQYDAPFTYNNLQFKTDDTEVVKIFTVSSRTRLDTLKDNNLFTCDIMLLEEE